MNSTFKVAALLFIALTTRTIMAEDSGRFMPSSSPVSIAPSEDDRKFFGFGSSLITMEIDWSDFYLSLPGTHEGNIELTANDFCLGLFRSSKGSSILEADIMIGKISTESGDAWYESDVLGATARMNIDGSGMNAGGRVVYSHNIFQQKRQSGGRLVDWNVAYSLHAAYFDMENEATLSQVSGYTLPDSIPQGYTVPDSYSLSDLGTFGEKESGIFLRFLVALQPIIYATDRIKLFPFIGIGTKETLTKYEWMGMDSALGDEIEALLPEPKDSTELENWGINTIAGFDMSIMVNKRLGHEITLGSAISKISGDEDSDFMEYHLLYSMPFGQEE